MTFELLFVGIIAVIVIGLVVFVALELYNSGRVSRLTSSVYEYALKRAEGEAERIVREAREEARRIVSKADEESLKRVESAKKESEAAHAAYAQALADMLKSLVERLEKATQATEEAQVQHSRERDVSLRASERAASKRLEELSHEHASRLEAHLVERFNQAEEEIASYERARCAVVDERMAALVVETTRIVLHKELTSSEHAELTEHALEEAKAGGLL